MDVRTLSHSVDWISGIRDTDPFVLTDRYNVDPRAASEILTNTNNLLDSVDRSTNIQGLIASLRGLQDETWTRIFEQPQGFHHVLVGIVSKNFFCGLSKDDFIGPGASLSKTYAYSLMAFLDTTVRYLYRLLLRDRPNPLLPQCARHTLMELNPVWDRLTQLAPTSSWRGFEQTTDLDSTPVTIPSNCAAMVGISIIVLYVTLEELTPAPTLNTQLITHTIHAFCLAIPTLHLHDFNQIVTYALSQPFAQEVHDILSHAFCDEVLAGMFLKAYCNCLTSGMHPPIVEAPSYNGLPPSEDINLRITQLFHLIVCDGPPPLIHVLSSPGILETLISKTLYACQYSRCSAGPEAKHRFTHPFIFTISAITLPVFKSNDSMRNLFSLHTRACHLLLCFCTLGLSAELESNPDRSAVLMDCIAIYALPGAKCDLSVLSPTRQHDIRSLRRIIHMNLREVRTQLNHMQNLNLRRRAAFLVRQILDEVLLDDMSAIPSHHSLVRVHRCYYIACECSGIKPPHRLRVCKGCFSTFYCSRECQKYDWDDHKNVCQ